MTIKHSMGNTQSLNTITENINVNYSSLNLNQNVQTWSTGFMMMKKGLFLNGHKLQLGKIYNDSNSLAAHSLLSSNLKGFSVHLDLFGLTPTTLFQYDFVRVKYNGVFHIECNIGEILCKQIFLEKVLDTTTLYLQYGIQIHLNDAGQLHREDGPAYVVPYKFEKKMFSNSAHSSTPAHDIKHEYWYLNGKLHRDSRDGPAIVKRFGHVNQPQFIAYYEHNVKHRDSKSGPAITKYKYDKRKQCHYLWTAEYYENGVYHRDVEEGPAFITYVWRNDIIIPFIDKFYNRGQWVSKLSQSNKKRKRDEIENPNDEQSMSLI